MNAKAVKKASDRLEVAARQLNSAERAHTHKEFSGYWSAFLASAKSIFNYLQVGSEDSKQSAKWSSEKWQLGLADELVCYMIEARNDDEHGIEEITHLEPGGITLGKAVPGYSSAVELSNVVIVGGKLIHAETRSYDGLPVYNEVREPRLLLKGVKTKKGVTILPPSSHLGRPLVGNDPFTVGRLYVAYLKALVAEAAALPS